MKVVLINPYLNYLGQSFANKRFQPLDLLNIASLLRAKGLSDLKVIDANLEKIVPTDYSWSGINADIFVITTSPIDRWQCPINNPKLIFELVSCLLKYNQKSRIIIYGFDSMINPQRYNFDFRISIISGEPEFLVANQILKAANKSMYTQKGIQYLPLPAFDLVDMKRYGYPIMGNRFSLIEFSRGCPYDCIFCSKIMYPKKYQTKTLKQTIQEILNLKAMGIDNLYFIDLEFCIRKEAIIELCREIIRNSIKVKWAIQSRIDHLDKGLLSAMKEAGCCLIHLGVESGSQKILDTTNKKIKLEQIRQTFNMVKEYGIKTLAYFMFGNLNETREDILKTINFSKELNPDYASFVLVSKYPGSELFKKKEICNLSLDDLEKLRRSAYLHFYFRWDYLTKKLKQVAGDPKEISIIIRSFFSFFIPLIKKNG